MKEIKNVLLLSLMISGVVFSQNNEWGYEGEISPENWGKIELQCGQGQYQSPINITNAEVDNTLPRLKFSYDKGNIVDIEDNEHTLQFDFDKDDYVIFKGKKYYLTQFHAHEAAEHTIDRVHYPLELHFVHKASDGTVLVIGILVKEGKESAYFKKLEVFHNLAKKSKMDVNINFDPQKIFPKNKSYYYYIGSLTTPPCAENVNWIVFKNPISMTAQEIDEIGKHLPKSNTRPIQPLNERVIKMNKK